MKYRIWLYTLSIAVLALGTLFLIGCPASSTTPTGPSSSADFVGVWHQVVGGVQLANESIQVGLDPSNQVLTILANGTFMHTHTEDGIPMFEGGRYIYAAPLLRVFIDSVSIGNHTTAGDSAHFNVLNLDATSMIFDSVGGSYIHQWGGFVRTGLTAATICGVTTNGTGTPIAGATVHATLGSTVNNATSNSWGFFYITGLSAGSWSVVGTSGSTTSNPVGVTTTATGIFPVTLGINVTNNTLGLIHGFVRNVNTQVGVANAVVIADSGNLSATTNANGEYTIAGAYPRLTYLTATATTYRASTVVCFVSTGDTTVQDINLAPSSAANGRVYGYVTNALNGTELNGATITCSTGETATTDATGRYSFSVPAGSRALVASKTGYISSPITVLRVTSAPDTVEQSFSLTPTITGTSGQLRFVLTWGTSPSDLDSHLQTPYTSYNGNGEVYWIYKGDSTAVPFATLDHDVVTGSGPETITIYQWTTGTYKYFIKNYSQSPDITTSGAVVNIYDQTGLIRQLHVPTTGTGIWWNVCTIDGTTHAITYVNVIQTTSPGAGVGKVAATEPAKH